MNFIQKEVFPDKQNAKDYKDDYYFKIMLGGLKKY